MTAGTMISYAGEASLEKSVGWGSRSASEEIVLLAFPVSPIPG